PVRPVGARRARAARPAALLRGGSGRRRDQPRLLHADAAAGRRTGRRHGQRHRRYAHPLRHSRPDRRPDWGAERHVRRRIPTIAVEPTGGFSAMAGGIALGVMMIPLITRTTEELLRLVPASLREGALALGATRGRAVLTVVLPAALPGIVTGVMLALARVAGETAPLLFTAFGNRFWSTDLTEPIGALTLQVYAYAISPYDDWHRQAWAGALVLLALVLGCSL